MLELPLPRAAPRGAAPHGRCKLSSRTPISTSVNSGRSMPRHFVQPVLWRLVARGKRPPPRCTVPPPAVSHSSTVRRALENGLAPSVADIGKDAERALAVLLGAESNCVGCSLSICSPHRNSRDDQLSRSDSAAFRGDFCIFIWTFQD